MRLDHERHGAAKRLSSTFDLPTRLDGSRGLSVAASKLVGLGLAAKIGTGGTGDQGRQAAPPRCGCRSGQPGQQPTPGQNGVFP